MRDDVLKFFKGRVPFALPEDYDETQSSGRALINLELLQRRQFPPVPAWVKAQVTVKNKDQYVVTDKFEVWSNGFRIRTKEPWDIGTKVEFEFYLLDEVRPYVGTGEVAAVDSYALHSGFPAAMEIVFSDIRKDVRGILRKLEIVRHVRKTYATLLKDFIYYGFSELRGNLVKREFYHPSSGFQTPVLLVHGFLGTEGALYPLERRLKAVGFPIFSVPFGVLNVQDIRKSAKNLSERVEDAIAKRGSDKIDIVGHSMGGLIGLYYIKRYGGDKLVRRMIAIGTPFWGSWLANLGVAFFGLWGKSSWQLRKNSDFIKDLHADPLPENVDFYCIMAKNDFLCLPADSALPGAKNYIVPKGHTSLVVSPDAFQYIYCILSGLDPLETPGIIR